MPEVGRAGEVEGAPGRWPGWGVSALALGVYVAAVGVATWPVFGSFTTAFPGPPGDPLQHLWIMRWSRACLLAGRAPFFCPDIQYPVGAPLGLFSPLNLLTLIYTALEPFVGSEVVAYNVIWLVGLLGTAMGTYLLAWYVVRDRAAAVFAGLAAVLSTPMMMHAQGHLELIQLGTIPVFLIAWLRFVDRPTPGRLLAAWGAFELVVAGAAYFVVLAPVPAVWYVAWRGYQAVRRGETGWLRARVVPLLVFTALAAAAVLVLCSSQVWAATHGFKVTRPYSEFEWFGAPPWAYVVPTASHALGRLLPGRPYEGLGGNGSKAFEVASYLGVVPLALLAYAALLRVRVERGSFWWTALALLVGLSLGATLRWGPLRIDLPLGWFWSAFPPLRLIRVPARFNLPACVVAAVLASAGLRDLMARLPRGWSRVAWCAAVVFTVVDLSVSPFMASRIPEMPAGYAVIDRIDRRAAVLDAPMVSSGLAHPLSAVCAYWQSLRGGRTTAGYSGHANVPFDQMMVNDSPFGARELADPSFLADPTRQTFGVVADVPYLDYAWLYLTAHKIDYVVLHHWAGSVHEYLVRFDRLKTALAGAKIAEDEETTVYERARLARPSGPVVLATEGWRTRRGWPGPPTRVAFETAKAVVYSPGPDRPLRVRLKASALREPREVRLLSDGVEVARWKVEPGDQQTFLSPPLRAAEGVHDLMLLSDGAARPRNHREAFDDRLTPYSLRVTGLGVEPADVESRRGTR